jgi:Tol biopolymer transport system component
MMAGEPSAAAPRGQIRRAWLVTGLAGWIIGGVYLIVAAANRNLVSDFGFSLYHLPAYAGLFALLAISVVGLSRTFRARRPWRAAFPPGYGPLGAATIVLVGYVALDFVWRQMFGIEPGVEGGLAPSRLLLPIGLVLLALGPVRAGLQDRSGGIWLPATIAAGLLVAAASVSVTNYNPIVSPWIEQATNIRQDDSEIWVMAADGSAQTRLLPAGNGMEYSLPTWSPDGRTIAFTRWQVGSEDTAAELWSVGLDGASSHQILSGQARSWVPAWSPDGTWIAYTVDATRPNSPIAAGGPQPGNAPDLQPASGPTQLWLVHPDGSGAHQLTTGGFGNTSASWSPDGSRIAFSSTRDGNGEIYVIGVDGSGEARLTNAPASDWAPAWAPDASRIAFTSDRTGDEEIWSMRPDGTDLRQLSSTPGINDLPAWSPDGSRIVFASDRSGFLDLWSMAPDGGDLRNLTDSPALDEGHWGIAFSPDGNQIAYAAAGPQPAVAQPLARVDLGAAGTLLSAVFIAILGLLVVGLGAPLGAVTLALAIEAGLASAVSGDWRFLPAILIGGVIVEALARRYRRFGAERIVGAGLPAAFVLAIGVTLLVIGRLGWSPTLWLGVSLAAGISGAVLGELFTRARPGVRGSGEA